MLFDDFVFPRDDEFQEEIYETPNTHHIEGHELICKRRARKNFRRSILDSWDNRCAYCGEFGDTLDHVRPRSKGGETKRSNLVCCCAKHNSQKSSMPWIDWFRAQEFWSAERESAIWRWLYQDFDLEDWA